MSAARLVDELWGDDPPATAAKAVQVHLSKLRSALGPEQPIVTRPSGYAVDIEPEQLDLARFEALSERARAARRGRPPGPPRLWREALALFRGPPLADVPLRGLAAAEAGRLAELESPRSRSASRSSSSWASTSRSSASCRRWSPSTPTASGCTRS